MLLVITFVSCFDFDWKFFCLNLLDLNICLASETPENYFRVQMQQTNAAQKTFQSIKNLETKISWKMISKSSENSRKTKNKIWFKTILMQKTIKVSRGFWMSSECLCYKQTMLHLGVIVSANAIYDLTPNSLFFYRNPTQIYHKSPTRASH